MNSKEGADLARLWFDVCRRVGDEEYPKGWYSTLPNILDEYNFCVKDAAEGNERAQRYLAAFVALRMTR